MGLLRQRLFQKRKRTEFESIAIFDGIADGVVVFSHQGEVVYWNLAAKTVLGIPDDVDVGRLLEYVVPNVGFVNRMYDVIQDHSKQQFPLSIELSLDENRFLSHTIYRSEKDNEIVFLVFCHRQITPVSRKAVSNVVTTLAHQLRAPLAAMESWLGVLASGEAFGSLETIQKRLCKLKQRAHLLLALVDDTLFLHHIQNEPSLDVEQSVPLVEIVKDIVDDFAILCKERGIGIENRVDASSQLMMKRGDAERILAVLIDNAIKYNRDNGRIVIDGFLDKKQICLSVSDTGLGIASEELDAVFQQYYRSDHVKQLKIKGSGLGLSIIKELIQCRGGKIEIDSKLNEGTRVTFWYPLENHQ